MLRDYITIIKNNCVSASKSSLSFGRASYPKTRTGLGPSLLTQFLLTQSVVLPRSDADSNVKRGLRFVQWCHTRNSVKGARPHLCMDEWHHSPAVGRQLNLTHTV